MDSTNEMKVTIFVFYQSVENGAVEMYLVYISNVRVSCSVGYVFSVCICNLSTMC